MLELFQITGSAASPLAPRSRRPASRVRDGRRPSAPSRRGAGLRGREPVATRARAPRRRRRRLRDRGRAALPRRAAAGPAGSARCRASRAAAELLRWILWLSNTLHHAYVPLDAPQFLTDDHRGPRGDRAQGARRSSARYGALPRRRARRTARGASARRSPSPTSTSTCSRAGRTTARRGSAAPPSRTHFARVGARPAIARARALDDLDERLLRYHPELRAGKPL